MRSVNQRLPSAPTVIPYGWLCGSGRKKSVITPSGVMRPIAPRSDSVNQRFPSGPVTIEYGLLPDWCSGKNVTDVLGTEVLAVALAIPASASASAQKTNVE